VSDRRGECMSGTVIQKGVGGNVDGGEGGR
jgi:hypothetical protein